MVRVAVRVAAVSEATPELVNALERLIPQLSSSSPPPGPAELAAIIASDGATILVARGDDETVLGTLTLVVFHIPTGTRAVIEDVVVDQAARGQGIGEALTKAALELAAGRGARTVDLTSRPSREAANRLYGRLGFQRRDTNFWRYTF